MRFSVPFLIILFLLVWGVSLMSPYQYDDFITPLQDPASQSLTAFFENLSRTLRPLTKFTYALESSLGLTEAYERRIFNLLLALGTSLLLFKTLFEKTKNEVFAFVLTLLWALHPVQAETFISLAGRSSLMAIFFMLLSLRTPKPSLKLLYAFLALVSKEVTILFFLYQIFILTKGTKKTAFLLGLVLIGTILNRRLFTLLEYSWTEVAHILNWWDGPAAISAGFLFYLRPWSVGVDPEFPYFASALWFFITLFLLSVVIREIWKNEGDKRDSLLLWLALILPTQSLIPKLDPLSLRTLSIAGLALPFVIAAYWQHRVTKKLLIVMIPFIVVTAVSTFSLAKSYESHVSLWKDASIKSQSKARPLVNLAYFLVRENKLKEALDALIEAQRREPKNFEVHERLRSLKLLIQEKAL